MTVSIRAATEADQPTIRAMTRGERLNPTGLDWTNFLVAAGEGGIVGAVQMRRHPDGSRELGTLVVAKAARGKGIATRLVDAILVQERDRVQMITDAAFSTHYERWGFRRIAPQAASASVRFNHRVGSLARILSFIQGRRIRRLVILERNGRADGLNVVRLPTR